MTWAAVGGAAVGVIGGAINNKQAAKNNQQQMAPSAFAQLPPHMQELNQQQYNLAMTQGMTPWGGFNPNQQQAFGMIQNRAGGSPTEQAAQGAVQRAASGNANPMFGMDNPYTTKAIDATTSDMQRQFNRTTAPMLDAMNSRANTGFGTSSAVDEMRTDAYQGLNDQMSQVSNDMRMKDLFAQQQMGEGMAGRQLQAANLAPSMQGMDYNNANALMGVGNMQQNAPMDWAKYQMGMFGAPFGSLAGGGAQMMAPQGAGQTSMFNNALGGAMMGQGFGNMWNQRTQPVGELPNYYPGDHQGYGG
jgi:hypothetical protein